MRHNEIYHKHKKFIVVWHPLGTYIHYLSNAQDFHYWIVLQRAHNQLRGFHVLTSQYKVLNEHTSKLVVFSCSPPNTQFSQAHQKSRGFHMLTSKHLVSRLTKNYVVFSCSPQILIQSRDGLNLQGLQVNTQSSFKSRQKQVKHTNRNRYKLFEAPFLFALRQKPLLLFLIEAL